MKDGTYSSILSKWGVTERRDLQARDQRGDELAGPGAQR